MIPIEKLMAISGRKETSIRARGVKLGIEPHYKTFTRGHLEVEYTLKEAKQIISSYVKRKYIK